ncbi:PRC-barrel domain containing protein [Aurantiacibacter poecillastricola]|uniref:PRC-barrel domain containing protein n=1 Tax=Aurantiacibacter poecillastricola TaxID=3064385 RepID=UPI00273DDE69|nr:PRC-barrel domain containing protein [Aurantiacibacter sp. 219JJ12-13]MDP5262869.1 PRC-barrel domain containing protein [Aurantiacibacter sp. 219JJ12-13]
MKRVNIVIAPLAALAITACESEAEQQADMTEDRIEQQAEQSAANSGNEIAALGLTERQLLDADLVSQDGTELGDVEQVRRDASGAVTGLLVEVEDSEPDRYVEVPLEGLSVTEGGVLSEANLQTEMTTEEVAAMPDAAI